MKRSAMATVAVVALVAILGTALGSQLAPAAPAALALEAPAFLDDDIQSSLVGEKIQDEAGIAAYYKAPYSLNLSLVRPMFNSIELEAADYILGSISVPNYSEVFDVHVYVRSDGWIMAYYLASAPTGKVVDSQAYSLNNTKLTIVMNNVVVTGGAPFGAVTYYHFNYPNANRLLLVGELSDSFTITPPSSFAYYEISFGWYGSLVLDGNYVSSSANCYGSSQSCGRIASTSFLPDVMHTVDPNYGSYGALAIIYREP